MDIIFFYNYKYSVWKKGKFKKSVPFFYQAPAELPVGALHTSDQYLMFEPVEKLAGVIKNFQKL